MGRKQQYGIGRSWPGAYAGGVLVVGVLASSARELLAGAA
jgi:hypothetical protein